MTVYAAEPRSPAPDPQPGKPVSAECIADIEAQPAKAKREGNDDGVPAFTRTPVGADG
ncbi:hypothetical protein G3M58_64245 [Streptomyces sp. SID7499]|uniref:Uncharacterized protein n=1 Tax=Streptomyces sp. SID7499 TaxID=2706086 RepID=A0A6G3XHT9_9ACTN|nr:hypothetical protein [Streptomyces sp. SID7499]